MWCVVYALEGGATTTIRELLENLDPKNERELSPVTVLRALKIAAECKLVARVKLAPPSGRRRWIWQRLSWPSSVSVPWLVERHARRTVAQNLLSALESGGYLHAVYKRRDA